MPRYSPDRSSSPVKRHESPPRKRTSVQQRNKSPSHHRRSHRSRSPVKTRSPEREKRSSRARSPRASVPSLSSSPRSKRLRRAQAEQEDKELADMDVQRGGSREKEKVKHRQKGSERDDPREGDDRRLPRDNGGRASRPRHERSASPKDRRRRDRYDSRSPSKATKNGSQDEVANTRGAEHSQDDDSVMKMKAAADALEAKKDKPSFELSGKLAEETNRVKGITLLFNEPPDARKPDVRWRLYVFKGGDVLNEPLYIHRQTCYLFGRERRVADIPTDHPSCSKQHAVIQFRQVEKEQSDGMLSKHTRPYIMDLGSTNGTYINENRIEPQRYYELIEKDTIKFGNSSREYVILHENSAE